MIVTESRIVKLRYKRVYSQTETSTAVVAVA
jgi:hypothetical protein